MNGRIREIEAVENLEALLLAAGGVHPSHARAHRRDLHGVEERP